MWTYPNRYTMHAAPEANMKHLRRHGELELQLRDLVLESQSAIVPLPPSVSLSGDHHAPTRQGAMHIPCSFPNEANRHARSLSTRYSIPSHCIGAQLLRHHPCHTTTTTTIYAHTMPSTPIVPHHHLTSMLPYHHSPSAEDPPCSCDAMHPMSSPAPCSSFAPPLAS